MANIFRKKSDVVLEHPLSSQKASIHGNLKILGDTFSGYSTFRNPAFVSALKTTGLNLQYANEFDQAKRAATLGNGQADILVTTLDQFLKQKPAGKIVGLIDRTVGADAVVLNTKQFPQLKSLLDLTQLVKQSENKKKVMTFAGDTPSEFLGLVLETKFEAFNLADFEIEKVADASQAWKKMQNPKENVAIAVLWEPFVTQARRQGNTVILSSRDTPNTIVDAIVASDKLIQSQPDKISQFLSVYYHRIDESSRLKRNIAEDGKLTLTDAASVLQGINFFSSLETQQWFSDGTLEKRIGSTAAILTLEGKLDQVPLQPKDLFTDRFLKSAINNTQKLINLIRASDPQYAERLERTYAKVSRTSVSKTEIQSASNIGNLALNGAIIFDRDSVELISESRNTLNKLGKEINEFNAQTVAVQIIGHTSQSGDAALNQNLSQLRAQVVADYLRSLGLKHKITAQGKGFSDALAGVSATDSQNQRTEIRLVRIN
jgi:OmpA-OmpF porin, OOP family